MPQSERERLSRVLMSEATAYAQEHKCSLGRGLSEVAKRELDLWGAYSEAATGKRTKPGDAPKVLLMGEVEAYARENGCSFRDALVKVAISRPELWRAYSDQTMFIK